MTEFVRSDAFKKPMRKGKLSPAQSDLWMSAVVVTDIALHQRGVPQILTEARKIMHANTMVNAVVH